MDIRCPSCDTLYAFDTSQFGPDGVNVRCSVCKAVFRVASSAPQPSVVWFALRPTTGMTLEVAGTVELQRLVMQGLITADDLISSDRVNWQRADAMESIRPFLSMSASLGNSPDSTRTIGQLSRTGTHEVTRTGRVAQITEGATSLAAAPDATARGGLHLPDRNATAPAPSVVSTGDSPAVALDDAATRNMHPLSDEEVGAEPVGRVTSTSGSVTPRATIPLREEGRSTTAVSPATVASKRLHSVEQVTSPTPSLPHAVGPAPVLARQENPAFSTSQFSVAPEASSAAPSVPSASSLTPPIPRPRLSVAPDVLPSSGGFATHAMSVHDVEAAAMRSLHVQSPERSASSVSANTFPDTPFSSTARAPVAPVPAPPHVSDSAGASSGLTQTMRTSPASRPPIPVAQPQAQTYDPAAPAPVAAEPAIVRQQLPTPPAIQPAQQVLREDRPTSPAATPRPAVQLKALRADGSRSLPDRYTLGRTGLEDSDDGWRVGDKAIDFPPEPGDGRPPRSETLDVPQLPGGNPVRKIVIGVSVLAVGVVAFVLMTRPSQPVGSDAGAEGSSALALGALQDTLSGTPDATSQGVTDGSSEASGSSTGEASSSPGEASAAEASAAAGSGAAIAAPPSAAESAARAANPTAPARRTAPVPPAEDDYDALMARAERALSARRYNEAVDLFSAAADESNRAEAHVGAGRAYAGMRQWHVALARFQRAIDRNPRYMPAWFELGNARQQNGDTAGALEAWQRVVDESRDQQLVRRAQSAIESAQ